MKVIISGGGSGGHIYPAIAIADGIKAEHSDAEILFVGAEGKMEMEKIPKAGYEIEGLKIRGLQRGWKLRNLTLPFKLLSSVIKAKKILRRFRPDVVIGVGGYASGPLLFAANKMKIPTLLQEQNSYPGITNKILGKRAKKICVAYENMDRYFKKSKLALTGNPVRTDIADLENKRRDGRSYFWLAPDQKVIFAFGGSLGAKTINESFLEQFELLKSSNVQLLWQTGAYYYDAIKDTEVAKLPNVHVHQFIDRMDLAYAAADVIVGRAGALTISELCMVGKPAILIPSPNVAEDHQTKNAQALAEKKAAILIKDKEAKAVLLKTALEILKNEEQQRELGENISKMAKPNATKAIVKEVLQLL